MNSVYETALAASMAAALSANANMASDKTQMRLYLDRVRAMVPQAPTKRRVSRQQLLEHVISSISDLHDAPESDSEDDSRPGSPMNDDDVSFSDAFSHQPQYGGYGVQPHQYSGVQDGGYGMQTHQYGCQGLDSSVQPHQYSGCQGLYAHHGNIFQYDHHSSSSYRGFSNQQTDGYNSDGSSCSGHSFGAYSMN